MSEALIDGITGQGSLGPRSRRGRDRLRLLRLRQPVGPRGDDHGVAQPGRIQRDQALPGRSGPGGRGHRPQGDREDGGRTVHGRATVRGHRSRPSMPARATSTICSRSSTKRQCRAARWRSTAGNGMAGAVVEAVFERIPPTIIGLYLEPDGTFPNHPADPLQPENLVDVIALVKRGECRSRGCLRRRRRSGGLHRRSGRAALGKHHHGPDRPVVPGPPARGHDRPQPHHLTGRAGDRRARSAANRSEPGSVTPSSSR